MRLLIVEDDMMIGENLQKALRKEGFVVNWAQDGETAEIALQDEDYDLVVLDLGLPGQSGLDVLDKLRKKGDDIPVLILTARDAVSDKVKGFDSGADDYLLKPFALEELEARNSCGSARMASRATRAFLRFSAASAAFHKKARVKNFSGTSGGARIKAVLTPLRFS